MVCTRFGCAEPVGVLTALPMKKTDNSKIIKRFLSAFGMTLPVCKKGERSSAAKPPNSFPQSFSLRMPVIPNGTQWNEESFATDATRWRFLPVMCGFPSSFFTTNNETGQEKDNQEIPHYVRNEESFTTDATQWHFFTGYVRFPFVILYYQ